MSSKRKAPVSAAPAPEAPAERRRRRDLLKPSLSSDVHLVSATGQKMIKTLEEAIFNAEHPLVDPALQAPLMNAATQQEAETAARRRAYGIFCAFENVMQKHRRGITGELWQKMIAMGLFKGLALEKNQGKTAPIDWRAYQNDNVELNTEERGLLDEVLKEFKEGLESKTTRLFLDLCHQKWEDATEDSYVRLKGYAYLHSNAQMLRLAQAGCGICIMGHAFAASNCAGLLFAPGALVADPANRKPMSADDLEKAAQMRAGGQVSATGEASATGATSSTGATSTEGARGAPRAAAASAARAVGRAAKADDDDIQLTRDKDNGTITVQLYGPRVRIGDYWAGWEFSQHGPLGRLAIRDPALVMDWLAHWQGKAWRAAGWKREGVWAVRLHM